MTIEKSWSLQKYLSFWLAIQSLLGLSILALAIYGVTSLNITLRQDTVLEQKQQIIRHLIQEVTRPEEMIDLYHKLKDFFTGQSDLQLRLTHGETEWFLGRISDHGDEPAAYRKRVVHTSLSYENDQSVGAELILDITADNQKKRWLVWTLLFCTSVGALLISFSSMRLVRRALRPVNALVRQTMQLVPDKPQMRLDGRGQAEEFQPLIKQFNAALERQESAYTQLEGFNADVAHELRTPLATLVGQTELALLHQHDAEALRETLVSNLEELNRLSNIVKDMLFLSQADQGTLIQKEYTSSLAALFHEVADYHEASLLDANLTAVVYGEASACVNRRLLKQALSNLLANATRHAVSGSTIELHIANTKTGKLLLSVSNTGCSIPTEQLSLIFNRFYRADVARCYHQGSSHGLGLAIVAAIARMHEGGPYARSSDEITTIGFTIKNSV